MADRLRSFEVIHRIRTELRWLGKRFRMWRFKAALRCDGVDIDRNVRLPLGMPIGPGTRIHRDCVFKGTAPISIGRDCEIAEGVRLISDNHRTDLDSMSTRVLWARGIDPLVAKGPVRIEDDVWIGDCAIVLSGVTVGKGAVVGAGAVVTKDVEPNAIVAGSPARLIRKRTVAGPAREAEES